MNFTGAHIRVEGVKVKVVKIKGGWVRRGTVKLELDGRVHELRGGDTLSVALSFDYAQK